MLNLNLLNVENVLHDAVEDKIRDLIIVGPKGSMAIAAKGESAYSEVIETMIDYKDDLGIDLYNVLLDYTIEKIDTSLYQLTIKNGDENENKDENENEESIEEETTNMINISEFTKLKQELSKEEEVVVTDSNFMDRKADDYGRSIQDDKNKSVSQITISSNVSTAIALLKDKPFKKLAFTSLKLVLGKRKGFNEGTGKYLGLFVEEIRADKVEMDYVTVSAELEELIIQEILNCDLNDIQNLRKIFTDINDLFRMYQELTIDAAKKLYTIEATFYNEIIKASSTIHLEHTYTSFEDMIKHDSEFLIYRNSRYAIPSAIPVGEPVEFKNNEGETKRIVFNDDQGHIQDVLAQQFCEFINTDVLEKYKKVAISKEVEDSFALGSEFASFAADMYTAIRTPYSKLIVWKLEEDAKVQKQLECGDISLYAACKAKDKIKSMVKEKLEELSNLARFYTKDMDMATAGKLMFMVSNIKKGPNRTWEIDRDSTIQMFLAVAPELFLAYIVKEHAEINVCGYKVLGNTSELVEGQKLTFVDGNAVEVENVYVDSLYSGELTVQTVDDVLSVVKPIEIPRIEHTTPKEIVVTIYESSVIDAVKFAKDRIVDKNATLSTLIDQKVFLKAEKVKLAPVYRCKVASGKTYTAYNAVVATIANINDPSIKYEIPVASYLCDSPAMELAIAGLTADKFGKIRLDGKNMRIALEYGKFEEVELNRAKQTEEGDDEVKGLNPDAYNPSSNTYTSINTNANVEDAFAPKARNTASVSDEDFTTGLTSDYDYVQESFEYGMDFDMQDDKIGFDTLDYGIFDDL